MLSSNIFYEIRPLLFSIAYRMTSSVVDSEDLIQDTFEKWMEITSNNTPSSKAIQHPKAYLCKALSNQCINYLKKQQRAREQYKGTWLPEPLVMQHPALEQVDHTSNLSYGIMRLLEQLNPLERAIYLCKESFDFNYSELANIFEKRPDHCRQLYHRASDKLQKGKKRFEVKLQQQQQLLQLFSKAAQKGEINALLQFLKEDIAFYSDGGGKVAAALNILRGKTIVSKFIVGVIRKMDSSYRVLPTIINQSLGMIVRHKDSNQIMGVFVFEWDNDLIQGIYAVRNPDKLVCCDF